MQMKPTAQLKKPDNTKHRGELEANLISVFACGGVGCTAALGNRLAVSQKVSRGVYLACTYRITHHLPRRNVNTCPQKDFDMCVLSGFIHNSPKLGKTQMSIHQQDKWLSKSQYSYSGILFRLVINITTSLEELTKVMLIKSTAVCFHYLFRKGKTNVQ